VAALQGQLHKAKRYIISFLPLSAIAQGERCSPEKSASILLCYSSFLISDQSIRGCLVSEQSSFYGVRLLASRPTPNLENQGILPLDLSGMGDPTSSYATAGITMGVSAHKHHQHDKVEPPTAGSYIMYLVHRTEGHGNLIR
jgi:hypothetical protein